ncbi:MAG TPA: zf-TFIIB domain-containing protein, partial [Polyangiaceae bacterium]
MSEHCFFCGHAIGEDGCESCGTVRMVESERRVRAPCPRCGVASRLVPFGVGDAALQACARCKGMFVSAPDWDTLLDVFAQETLPDVVVPDAEGSSSYGPYRSAPISSAPQIDLVAPVRCPTCETEMDRL